ncbi:MAG: histidine phosphatase family protein [Anaerolineae bacterium]
MTVQQVFIVRHGETDYNLSGRWQGHLDIPLNRLGREQAQQVASALASRGLQAVYSSDLARALETAQAIAAGAGLTQVRTDKRLRELNCGIFQGLTRSEIALTYPLEINHWDHSDDFVIPTGESRLQVKARVADFWQYLMRHETAERVAIVSHGGSIRWLLNSLFDKALIDGYHFVNTSVTTLEREGDHWKLVTVGDASHLDRSARGDLRVL